MNKWQYLAIVLAFLAAALMAIVGALHDDVVFTLGHLVIAAGFGYMLFKAEDD